MISGLNSLLTSAGGLWPIIAAIALALLYPSIRRLLDSRSLTLEIGGLKLSAQQATTKFDELIRDLQQQIDLLKADIAHQKARDLKAPLGSAKSNLVPESTPFPSDDTASAMLAGNGAAAAPEKTSPPKHVLWVDDKPEGNAVEISRLNAAEVELTIARSTADAMKVINSEGDGLAAVITDMSRLEGNVKLTRAGLALIQQARAAGLAAPIIVYTGYSLETRPAFRGEINRAGGTFATSSSVELFQALRKFADIRA